MIAAQKYRGCFKGLAIGDAFGAAYEGGSIERAFWYLIGTTADGKKRFTDDTQMSIDLASSYLAREDIEQNDLASQFARSYRWSRGYGLGSAKILKGIRRGKAWQDLNCAQYKEGSMGNGAAMRAPIVALCHPVDDERLKEFSIQAAEVTHAHPIAKEGAYIVALATCMALKDRDNQSILDTLIAHCDHAEYVNKLKICASWLSRSERQNKRTIKRHLGNGVLATQSCITAIYFGLGFRDSAFEDMLSGIAQLGGDADTIGAMAGALWGAFNGDDRMDALIQKVEMHEEIHSLADQLHKKQL
ncbi:MAG: hypothetical protein CMF25_07405 [Kangiellaceae bacterium]|nr:hypothetical protein [Kangiellaceae bacterium]|tara:strand:- start:626 stop:1531 length:906 start_codon:yes stop_codon:yes gene_type:complete